MENQLKLAAHPKVENSVLENDIIEVVGGFFTGYGWKNTGDSIMMLDDGIDHACGAT
jgi:hypothetical protein